MGQAGAGARAVVTDVVEALLDLVVPRSCAGCGVPQVLLCAACRVVLSGPARRTAPRPSPPGFPPTWTVTTYDGAVREALLAHKERGRLGLAAPLGDALALAVAAVVEDRRPGTGWPSVALVPVPSTRAATRARGHDPMLRTARRAAYVLRRAGRPTTVAPVLAVARRVSDQAGLGAAERSRNLAGAHHARDRIAARLGPTTVVLVDDLVTTGASLAEATRALRAVGLVPAGAAVVAATARRGALDRAGRTG